MMMDRSRTQRPAVTTSGEIKAKDTSAKSSISQAPSYPTKRNGSRVLFYIVLIVQAAGLLVVCDFILAPRVQDAEYMPPILPLSNGNVSLSGQNLTPAHTGALPISDQEKLHGRHNSNNSTNTTPRVEFLATQDLNLKSDAFAATWWQTRERFLRMNPDGIHARSPERAVFKAILNNEDVAMTVDWLQFSVEHLSKWWKTADYDGKYNGKKKDPIAYDRIVTNLLTYIQKSTLSQSDHHKTAAMPDTLAAIAFMPYTSPPRRQPVWAKHLTVVNLAATIASLVQVGCGRVVVVAGQDGEQESLSTLQAAIRLLRKQSESPNFIANDDTGVLHQVIHQETANDNEQELLQPFLEIVGSTEIGFVATNVFFPYDRNSNMTVKNVPRAALAGLRKAFLGRLPPRQQESWLGKSRSRHADDDSSAWKYVYLTEPDTLLQTRVDVFSIFQKAMDEGKILAPHRLQPIPHEYDLQGYKDARYYLPALGPFQNVSSIHAPSVVPAIVDSSPTTLAFIFDENLNRRGACCDGGIQRPWQRFQKCPAGFWYLCGFERTTKLDPKSFQKRDLLDSHFLLWDYPLMQLSSGSNIVSLAGTEHGRRCFPQEHGECPMYHSHHEQHQASVVQQSTTMSWDESRILHSVQNHQTIES